MMMIGERNRANPTVSIPPWSVYDDPMVDMISSPNPVSGVSASSSSTSNGDSGNNVGDYSPFLLAEALNALQRYLPSNEIDSDSDIICRESDIPIDAYSCDEFRMYEFKVRRCARGRSHDWTECPYAHPGEKARRRDPRKFHYSGTACPDFRKGNCKRGDACEYAHGVFECWLHPARYRTQPCKDGTSCRRRVCFFAHTPDQLRVLAQQSPRIMPESPPSYDGSPLRHAIDSYYAKGSPTSTLFTPPISPPAESPPMSPNTQSLSRPVGPNSMNDIVASFRQLQLNKVKAVPPLRAVQMGSGFSPRGISSLRPVFNSLPNTPTQTTTRSGIGKLNFWDSADSLLEEPVMDRVESGRELRAKMFEKLSKENSLERDDRVDSSGSGPDVGWVSELVK
ncbi:Zinc finger ccch domain-containing protein [Thalictrum thalictroides]|uniref:Zinc finger ccch domain-containing protein n=1 Tax=Thalictrum thalictroides TaxID=46969 RepID=A0A7J6XGS5_THATH|nr:Zinc finger ccch domain-containing protein [Thalictrum thalictroides]